LRRPPFPSKIRATPGISNRESDAAIALFIFIHPYAFTLRNVNALPFHGVACAFSKWLTLRKSVDSTITMMQQASSWYPRFVYLKRCFYPVCRPIWSCAKGLYARDLGPIAKKCALWRSVLWPIGFDSRCDVPLRLVFGHLGAYGTVSSPLLGHLKNGLFALSILAAGGGWGYVVYNQHQSHDPLEIVRKHFVFYPEYSHGIWGKSQCAGADGEGCWEVTYTVPVQSCGPVTFDWRVFPDGDGDPTWSYNGSRPHVDENEYPLYAILNQDSHLIDSPALGKPLPATCSSK